MQDVASTGLIVVVPFTGAGGHHLDADDSLTAGPTPCGKEYDDMLLALNYTMANPSAHSAFATADFSRVGAFGHSMGGSAATRIAEFGASSGVNVVAAVASHGAASVTNIDVPTLFTTGTLDTKDHDDAGNPNHFRHEFDICSSPTKVFVNLKGGYHMEPCEGKRMNFLTAQFLSCHVNGNQDHCNYIYGADGLCARDDLQNCTIVKPDTEIV
jgi:S-formylglutathione hydrolase FrmB